MLTANVLPGSNTPAFWDLWLLALPKLGPPPALNQRKSLLLFHLFSEPLPSLPIKLHTQPYYLWLLKDLLIVILSGDIRISPTPKPLWFTTPSTYTFQNKGSCKEIAPTDFPSMFYFFTLSSNGVLANSTTRSTRT